MNPTQFAVICVFTGLVALGFIIQGIALFVISSKMKALANRVEELSASVMMQVDRIVPQLDGFLPLLKSTAEKVSHMSESLAGISKVAHERAIKVDAFVDEATDAARLQIARLQDAIDTTARRIDETVRTLETAVSAPVREIQAIARGIRTGVDVLFGRRRSANRSHDDEEMFI
jgi:ABC-type transporter Mla subunit MlaD